MKGRGSNSRSGGASGGNSAIRVGGQARITGTTAPRPIVMGGAARAQRRTAMSPIVMGGVARRVR